ncbi:MAG: hypothetical protein IPN34_20375 [Planctomycetes bacterium]|nr:hypothetical protein [Planctomycetota bacterium]
MRRSLLALVGSLALGAFDAHAQSLTTTFASDNGRSSLDPGCFFDVSVLRPLGLTIHQLDVNVIGTVGANVVIDVYLIPGTYVGNDTNAAAWTKVSTGQGPAVVRNSPTPIDVEDFFLAPGSYGLYVHHTNSGVAYTNGNGANQQYGNAELSLSAGIARSTRFGGSLFSPRIWNGTIHYCLGNATYGRYGAGCSGTGGVLTLQPAPGSRPVLGSTFQLDVTNLGVGALPILWFGISKTSWFGVPLPFDLSPLGATGCWLLTSSDVQFQLVNTGSAATFSAQIPNQPVFSGAVFQNQVIAIDPGANPASLITSNGGEGCVGT